MTKKQQQFFKELLTSSSHAEAARKAGYSSKSCHVSAHRNIRKYNAFFLQLLIEAGIDIDTIAKLLREGLESYDKNLRFRYLKLCLDLSEKALSDYPEVGASNDVDYSKEFMERVEKYPSDTNDHE